jgi:anti-sigma factor RsiW
MNVCERIRRRDIHLYLDHELSASEVLAVEKHLIECAQCQAVYQELRTVVDLVRGAQPLYEPPEGSFEAVRVVVVRRGRARYRFAGAAAAAVAVAAVVGLVVARPSSAGEFGAFAADSHLRYERRAMPLDIASGEPAVVSGWLGARVPFRLELPDYPQGGEPKRYRLTGARVLQYRNRDVAFLAYEMDGKPISLLMTTDPAAAPSGGAVYRSGALKFHFNETQGLKLIAWTDRGIHYSLVSALDARGAESCFICHETGRERRMIDDLKPGQIR